MDWEEVKEKIGAVIGGAIVIALTGGAFFSQCVYPFIRDAEVESEKTFTCADKEFVDCSDATSLGGFTASVCGPNNIHFTVQDVKGYGREGDVITSPALWRYIIECPPAKMIWTLDQEEKSRNLEDARPANSSAELAVKLLKRFSAGEISLNQARQQLLAPE